MKTQINDLQTLARRLTEDAEAKADYQVPTTCLRLDAQHPNVVHVDDGDEAFDLEALPNFHSQVAERLGIPLRYYQRCKEEAPHILAAQVNGWWQAKPESRLIRTHSNRARAYLSDRYGIIDNDHVAQIVLPVIADVPGVTFQALAITDERFYVKITSARLEGEVGEGDPVQLGLAITNSEIGAGAFKIEPLLYRLVCKNGLIRQDDTSFRANHVTAARKNEGAIVYKRDTLKVDAEATLLKARDTVSALLTDQTLNRLIENFAETKQQKVEVSPRKAVERLGKAFSLTENEQDNVLAHLLRGGDLTRFGVINAVTRASQDIEDYDRAHAFEALGGKILNLRRDEWSALAVAA